MPDVITVSCVVNGRPITAQVPRNLTLMDFLRERLGLTGTKNGCATGHCGACMILLNGKPVRSCLVKMSSARMAGGIVETVESLAPVGSLHPLQQAFVEHGAVQCGFCIPG
ncbi:MAG: 2Fe-2S iron-sulfur cluster binding domain-containing protein, partial [Rhodospirillales bacterium]|nr:2Fe-2S iron-sulfur cluster binding domain-containing protein [Rhodospirillales bacterium]